MLIQRLLVAIVLLPLGLGVIHLGGPVYALVIALLLAVAAWEYTHLFEAGGYRPAWFLIVPGVLLVLFGRYQDNLRLEAGLLTAVILVSMTYHLLTYERGRDQAGTDFAITLAGVLYLGWLGAYFISLRALPDGKWWLLLALPGVWLADSGAFFIGRRFGRTKLSPRLSPHKTWEGYLGGVVVGVVGSALLAAVWRVGAGPESLITPWRGALLGGLLAVITPLGDLGESMLKRQVGVKDSGRLLPGHGGAFDRIDSWLWGMAIGYYVVLWFLR